MKKYFYLAVAACVALAACSKNEVTPIDVDQEITFQTVVNKASSRAMIDDTTYPVALPFGTFAYYYTGTYADATTKNYIVNSEVKNETAAISGLAWTTVTPYYWPKSGKLAFYSYSPYTISSSVTCDTSDGIKISNWDVNDNQTVDVMVADFQKDKTKNDSYADFTGVPTIFRHKLAQVVKFRIKTDMDYSTGTLTAPQIGDKYFFLDGIKIGKIAYKGTFTSGQEPSSTAKGSWDKTADRVDTPYVWYTESAPDETEFDNNFKVSPCDLPGDYLLVLPQEMTAKANASDPATTVEYVELNYTIRTFWGDGTGDYSDDEVTYQIDLKTITGAWEINKKYSYDITVSLNQIYWAPSVAEWETDTDSFTVNS